MFKITSKVKAYIIKLCNIHHFLQRPKSLVILHVIRDMGEIYSHTQLWVCINTLKNNYFFWD